MARTNKNSMSYLSVKEMTDEDYKKAVKALNTRIKRVEASKFSSFSRSLEEINTFKTVVSGKNYQGSFPTSMITKTGNFSSSLKNMTDEEKKIAKDFVKQMLLKHDMEVPNLRKHVERRAKELNTSVDKYLKDKEFWQMFREIKDETSYGSDQVFNAIETIDPNDSYEYRKEKAKEAIDNYRHWLDKGRPDYTEIEPLAKMSSKEFEKFRKIMKKSLTKSRVKKRSVYKE